jgi:uncharacterized OB-fold protein
VHGDGSNRSAAGQHLQSSQGVGPRPIEDATSRVFWQAAEGGTLVVQRCARCLVYFHPPELVCWSCLDDSSLAFLEVSGRGVVRSWIVANRAFVPGYVAPYAVVDVELIEQSGLRIIGELVGPGSACISYGMQVSARFDGTRILKFAACLAGESNE